MLPPSAQTQAPSSQRLSPLAGLPHPPRQSLHERPLLRKCQKKLSSSSLPICNSQHQLWTTHGLMLIQLLMPLTYQRQLNRRASLICCKAGSGNRNNLSRTYNCGSSVACLPGSSSSFSSICLQRSTSRCNSRSYIRSTSVYSYSSAVMKVEPGVTS